MLVALVVLSLVVAGLSQGLRFGLQVWSRATTLMEASDTLNAVDRTLRQMVAHMHPGQASQPAPIVGDPTRLSFVSTLPGLPPRRIEAVLLVNAQRRLVLRWRPYINAQRLRPPDFIETELLRDVSGFSLAYWQPDGGWSDRWHSADLPALIRLRLQPGGRRWPDIVVAPGLDRP
jgi:general secretion pathway protein J